MGSGNRPREFRPGAIFQLSTASIGESREREREREREQQTKLAWGEKNGMLMVPFGRVFEVSRTFCDKRQKIHRLFMLGANKNIISSN